MRELNKKVFPSKKGMITKLLIRYAISIRGLFFLASIVLLLFLVLTRLTSLDDETSIITLKIMLIVLKILIIVTLVKDVIHIVRFIKINYDAIHKKEKESYDLLEEWNIYLGSSGFMYLSYKILIFFSSIILWFVLMFILFLVVPLDRFIINTTIDEVNFLANRVGLYIFSFLLIIIILKFLITNYPCWKRNYFIRLLVKVSPNFLLIILLLLSIFRSIDVDANENLIASISANIMVIITIFIFDVNRMFLKNTNILRDYKGIFKSGLDLVLIDEPIDKVDNLNSNCREMLYTLQNIFEQATTNVPITIALNGTWGSGKSSIAKTLSVQLSKINSYSFSPINLNDKYKKKYFVINIDLLKYNSPLEITEYVHNFIRTLCKIFLINKSSTNLYFLKILELFGEKNEINKLRQIIGYIKKTRFSTMEELKLNFQEVIEELLIKSKREGILLIIDDIDRIPNENAEHDKIYALLKEFFDIYGIKTLVLQGTAEDRINNDSFKMQKFVNVKYDVRDFNNISNGMEDEYFNRLIYTVVEHSIKNFNCEDQIANFFNDYQCNDYDTLSNVEFQQKSFDFFDYKIMISREKEYFAISLEKFSLKYFYNALRQVDVDVKDKYFSHVYYEKQKEVFNTELVKEFLDFINKVASNPRSYKIILRKAVLERRSILQSFMNEYLTERRDIDKAELSFLISRMIYLNEVFFNKNILPSKKNGDILLKTCRMFKVS